MGTYHELRCVDCDETGGVYADRNPGVADRASELSPVVADFAEALLKLDPKLVQLADSINAVEVSVGEGYPLDLEWILKHKGHKIVACDGYGQDHGQCRDWSLNVQCALEDGHVGPHSVEGPHSRRRKS